jgi:hypothetical protein
MQKSESIAELAKALASFQAEVKNPPNTADNPFYKSKYAPLQDVLNVVRPLLSKHGLSILQIPSSDGETVSVTTLLMHSSGEWIQTDPLVLKTDKPTAQGAGSAITYARRYSLSAVLGISSEDDDDGNIATGTKHETNNLITKSQKQTIAAIMKKKNIAAKDGKEMIDLRYGKTDSSQLTKREASDLIEFLNSL